MENNEKVYIHNIMVDNKIEKDFINPPTISNLNDDYTSAKEYHDRATEKIDYWLKLFEANERKNRDKNRSSANPKTIKKNAKWSYPSIEEPILSKKSIISLSPRTFEDKKATILNEVVINYQLENEINFTKFINDATRDFVNKGTLIVKTGWKKKKNKIKKVIPVYEERQSIDENGFPVFDQFGMPVMEKVKIGTEIKNDFEVVSNHPTLDILNYKKVIIDPTAKGNIDDAQFIIYEYETNLSNLKKEGIYSNLDYINVDESSASLDEETEPTSNFNFKDKPRKRLIVKEYWGYWDIYGTGETEQIVCTYVNNVIIGLEVNPLPFTGLPFEIAHFEPVDESNYGEPDAEVLAEYQQNIKATTRAVIDITARTAAGQEARPIGWLDPVNKRKYENGEDYEYNPFSNPKEAIHTHVPPDVPAGVWNFIQHQGNEAVELAGRKPFGIGRTGSNTSATEIRSHLDSTSKREIGVLRRFTSMLERSIKKMIALNRIYLDDGQIFRITNDKFLAINREHMYGEFDIKIEIATPEQVENKIQKKTFLLQTLGNNIPFGITKKILASISDLEEDPELANDIREYEPQPDPLEEKEKMLKNALLEAQIAVYQSTIEENASDAELNRAKAQEALAKIQKIKAEADALDLDFIHKSEGTDQMRRLEEEQQRINSKLDLKQLEARLNKK